MRMPVFNLPHLCAQRQGDANHERDLVVGPVGARDQCAGLVSYPSDDVAVFVRRKIGRVGVVGCPMDGARGGGQSSVEWQSTASDFTDAGGGDGRSGGRGGGYVQGRRRGHCGTGAGQHGV